MRNKVIFIMAAVGLVVGLISAYLFAVVKKPQPPAFKPASNPYRKGIYANGIVESYQSNGANVNIYPEVAGAVTAILISEGERVRRGTPLVTIEDSVQRALVSQQKAQAEAAGALLDELKAQPRRENLAVGRAQVEYAQAGLKTAEDQLAKIRRAVQLNPKAVSRDALDNAENAVKVATAGLAVATRQYELTKAGAWIYDIRNQQGQHRALSRAFQASNALLDKYVVRAPVDGVILSIKAAVGSYISPQGTYDTYTQGFAPVVTMGSGENRFGVRVYVDEILVPRLPPAGRLSARMFIRGTDQSFPLEYVRVQPYVSPKIDLSNQRAERVDVRVLPVIFRLAKPDVALYPGQLVDVYIGER